MSLKAKDRPDLSSFQWDDALMLKGQLSEDERMLRDAAREFAQSELQPRVIKAYAEETVAPELFPLMGQAGLLGASVMGECLTIKGVCFANFKEKLFILCVLCV